MDTYCRLCLQELASGDNPPVETVIKDESSGETLADKIYRCLGVFVGPHDLLTRVCRNCEATVQLIDEFRSLCLQNDDLQQSIRLVGDGGDKRTEYYDCVGKLREMVRGQREAVEDALRVEDEEEDIAPIEPIDIKEEGLREYIDDGLEDGSNASITEKTELSGMARKDSVVKTIRGKIKLHSQIIEAIYQRLPQLTCETSDIDHQWRELSQQVGLEVFDVRWRWYGIRKYYKQLKRNENAGKQIIWNSTHALTGKIVLELDQWADTAKQEEKIFSSRLKARITEEIHNNPSLWSPAHQSTTEEQNPAWEEIAQKYSLEVSKIKDYWSRLQRMYQIHRDREKQTGQRIKCNERLAIAMKLLQEMLEPDKEEDQPIVPGPISQISKVDQQKIIQPVRVLQMSETIAFAKTCSDYELIWNTNHPDYRNMAKRMEVFDAIAVLYDMPQVEVKKEYKRLRSIYRKRSFSQMVGFSDLYSTLNKMFNSNSKRQFSRLPQIGTRTRLAEEILKREIIWNSQHPNYQNAKERGQAWREMATELGVDKELIRQEWNRVLRRSLDRRAIYGDKGNLELIAADPLHELIDKTLPEKVSLAAQDGTGRRIALPKRRNAVKAILKRRKFKNDGSQPVVDSYGVTRYFKVCELCGKSMDRSYFECHMNQHNGLKPYACSFEGCDRKYSHRRNRDRHVAQDHDHDESSIFKCDQCGIIFKQKKALKCHFAKHRKRQEVPCSICGKILKHKRALSVHVKGHTMSYTCEVCGKTFKIKYALVEHMRLHTKEKPYECEQCGQRFRVSRLRKQHLLKVHNVCTEDPKASTSAGSGGSYGVMV